MKMTYSESPKKGIFHLFSEKDDLKISHKSSKTLHTLSERDFINKIFNLQTTAIFVICFLFFRRQKNLSFCKNSLLNQYIYIDYTFFGKPEIYKR